MMWNALILSMLSALGLAFAWKKLPEKVRSFMLRHPLLVDVLTFGVTFYTLGGTLTALTAGAIVGIITSILLHIEGNKDDFFYMYDLRDFITKKLAEVHANLKNYASKMRAEGFVPAQALA